MLPTPSSPFRAPPSAFAAWWGFWLALPRAERAEFFVFVAALPALFALFAALWIMLPA